MNSKALARDDGRAAVRAPAIAPASHAGAINPAWTLERMFGKRRWAREWAAELCHADSQFLLHLIDQPHDYAHFLCIIALGAMQKRARAAECARMLRTQSKKKSLRFFHPDVPDGILGMLPKFGRKPLARKTYARLLRVMQNRAMRKHLLHAERIGKRTFAVCEMLESLPPEFRTAGVARCLQNSDGEAFHIVPAGVTLMRHLKIKMTKEQVARETRGMLRMQNLQGWFTEKFGALAFPPPPWVGNARIKPLRSDAELKDAARAFGNCAKQYLIKAALGYSCIYVCERPKVMVETLRDPVFAWKVGEMEKAGGKKISEKEEKEICRIFQAAGFDLAPQVRITRRIRTFQEYWEMFG